MNKLIRLTKKTAAALIEQELGISAGDLKRSDYGPCTSYIYELQLGNYTVNVRNDWDERNGLIVFTIRDRMGMGSIRKYFHHETLEEDFEAGDRYRKEVREEICEDCPHCGTSMKKWE